MALLDQIVDGRTDLVFEYLTEGHSATAADEHGCSLVEWCAYYGDVSALKYLGLIGACFHGHWQLVRFLCEQGAKPNYAMEDTGETPLHTALSQHERTRHNQVIKVLLEHGAKPNKKTKKNVPTGAFMRDCRTKGETPLHRAAAFGDETVIQMLLDAGANVKALDMNSETPLSWASWHARPTAILRKLLYGPHRIRPEHVGMEANLVGRSVA